MSKQTSEIAKAIGGLSEGTLKASLEQLAATLPALKDKQLESLSKDDLLQRYQEAVLDVGLYNFVDKLNSSDLKSSCATLGLEQKDDEECKKLLKEKLEGSKGGINGLIEKADESLLKKFCATLGLEPDDKDDMIKQIADEVMLTGMESFLNKLTTPNLKGHCSEMKLSTGGNKSQMVERLMVNIFELEPLEGEESKSKEKSKSKAKANGDAKKKSKEKAPKSEDKSKAKGKGEKKEKSKEKETKEEKKEKDKEKEKEKKKEKKEKPAPKKKEKFVAPPLDDIRKGKYDTHVLLYDHYNLPDLQGYCKKENLKVSGKKPELIKRILQYLEKGKVEEKPSKKRKRGSSAKKSSGAKKQKKEEKPQEKEEKKQTEEKKEEAKKKEDEKEPEKEKEKRERRQETGFKETENRK